MAGSSNIIGNNSRISDSSQGVVEQIVMCNNWKLFLNEPVSWDFSHKSKSGEKGTSKWVYCISQWFFANKESMSLVEETTSDGTDLSKQSINDFKQTAHCSFLIARTGDCGISFSSPICFDVSTTSLSTVVIFTKLIPILEIENSQVETASYIKWNHNLYLNSTSAK